MGTEDCLAEDVGDGGGKFSRRQHSIRAGGGSEEYYRTFWGIR